LVHVTVIVPFHRNLAQLGASLAAVRRSVPDAQLIVAADGALDDCRPLAAAHAAEVVVVPGPSGPAVARNRAAAGAAGDILVFVDADVVVAPDAVSGMCALLDSTPGIAGVFGAYDHEPPETNFMSQFKNLSHAHVHEVGDPDAITFWAGLGAVRADAFRAVGGFDERFTRPSVEDIEIGYRLTRAGYRLRLDPAFRGRHLKRWTLWSCIVTDIRARGVPWTQLIHRFSALANDLNTSTPLRLSVVAACLAALALPAALVTPWAWLVVAAMFASLVALNFDYYRWFARMRGVPFAAGVVLVHWIHHVCNGVSFIVGTGLHMATVLGVRVPGALPPEAWTPRLASETAPRVQS
jgi:GT2 family glycosyltransferase